MTTGLGSTKIVGDLDKSLLHVAFREKGRGSGDSEASGRAPKGTEECTSSWMGTLEDQDAKWVTSGPSKAPSALSAPWQDWAHKPQCGGPHPILVLQLGAEGYPSPLLSFMPPSPWE